MIKELKPIIITPEQIIAAAQLIAKKDDNAWEYTPEQYVAAVRNYLACEITNLVSEADWHANQDLFDVNGDYAEAFCDTATELVLPNPPEWAYDTLERSVQ